MGGREHIDALRRHVGRRGATLLFFGCLDLIYAASMIDASTDVVQHNTTYKWFGSIVSLSFWASLWIAVGLACIYHAFRHNDRLGFVAAIGIKVVWGIGSVAGWILEDVQVGSVAIWLGLAGLVWIISGWPEPQGYGDAKR